jgi:Recombinase zinc beta ribbon domain
VKAGVFQSSSSAEGGTKKNRYYCCSNHDPIKAGGPEKRCTERRIRADELDAFVFEQMRRILLRPDVLLAGEQALIAREPTPDDELLAAQLTTRSGSSTCVPAQPRHRARRGRNTRFPDQPRKTRSRA